MYICFDICLEYMYNEFLSVEYISRQAIQPDCWTTRVWTWVILLLGLSAKVHYYFTLLLTENRSTGGEGHWKADPFQTMITPLALGLWTQVYMYVIEHGSIRENCWQPSKDEMANIKKKQKLWATLPT